MSNEIIKYSYEDVEKIGKVMVSSGYFKDTNQQSQAIVKILAGRELGFDPYTSMSGIHIIQGKPVISANLMASALKKGGKYDYKIKSMSEELVEIDFYEGKTLLGTSSFSTDDAKKAGIASKDNWHKYARNMLFARSMSNGIRWYCPDVFNGSSVYTPGEIIEEEPKQSISPAKAQVYEAEKVEEKKVGLQPQHHTALESATAKMKAATPEESKVIYDTWVKTFQGSAILTEEAVEEAIAILSEAYLDLSKNKEE